MTTAAATPTFDRARAAIACVAAWLIPGAGHLLLGRHAKGLVFLTVLLFMFALGLALDGRIFAFTPGEPLVALAALANLGQGLPWLMARGLGYGAGVVTSPSFEYGNTFLIVAGLLNMLVVLDAYDIAAGRK
jgi:hypothetical protein